MASTSQINPRFDCTIGQIETSGSVHWKRINNGVWWCLDNGVFTNKFNLDKWVKQMASLEDNKDKCLFVAIPDVVGDCKKTIDRFHQYKNYVKVFPVAFVSQDGIMDLEKEIPWDKFDCLFIGGSDEHKLGKEGGWIINEAKKHNKWIHVGRVNSASRILKFWQADSWDGTHLGFNPSSILQFHAAVLQVRDMKKMKGLI